MEFLWRYTELPFLIHLLKAKRLTLISPCSWDDTNDSFYIETYRKRKKLKTILALCFTETRETYHHWKVFSGTTSGVSIAFYKSRLVSWAKAHGLRCESVKYYNAKELSEKKANIDNMPFTKRKAYKDENEFRLLYENDELECTVREFEIEPVIVIKRIRINPWLPIPIVASVRDTIRSIEGCESLEVYRTTLVDNLQWKKAGSSLV
jgi:hypothetical protein